jgi:hypothetical protein
MIEGFQDGFFVDAHSVTGYLHRMDVRSVAEISGVHASSFDEEDVCPKRGKYCPPLHPHGAKAQEVESNSLHGLVQERTGCGH